ncbi:MAG TPA: UDP-N-acetylmuramoyl-L-alanine--D-glutamate ligase [Planctomycetaceae bacterium]|nr:UDP-N-acetylmuramoyl-L-alanine--D-glutamate ligase [Planctomycetaceae bacterium]
MNLRSRTARFSGQRVTVMGLGRFGGGVGAVRFLVERGARVTVTDLAREEELADSLAQLDGLPIDRLVLGRHERQDFEQADLVVVNPAVPCDSAFLQAARQAGVPLTSEMNLFWLSNRGRTIGVTGSSGKSTTAALLDAILQAAGVRSRLGGNIGTSLLPVVDEIEPDEWVVLELSSFQLDGLDGLAASPEIAVVTNFSPNHLDRHGTLATYRRAKQTILRWQDSEQTAILNCDDPDVSAWAVRGRTIWFGRASQALSLASDGVFLDDESACVRRHGEETRLPLATWLKLPGRHNQSNAAAAIAAAVTAGVAPHQCEAGLGSFGGLPHRLEFVAERSGRRFYNDSKATTPEAAILALESFDAPIVLLAGGSDKHVDLGAFAGAIRARVRAVALMGETGATLWELLCGGRPEPPLPARACHTFDEALDWAWRNSTEGDVVLLSPGCASYDWFRDYTARGARFAEFVCRLT